MTDATDRTGGTSAFGARCADTIRAACAWTSALIEEQVCDAGRGHVA